MTVSTSLQVGASQQAWGGFELQPVLPLLRRVCKPRKVAERGLALPLLACSCKELTAGVTGIIDLPTCGHAYGCEHAILARGCQGRMTEFHLHRVR